MDLSTGLATFVDPVAPPAPTLEQKIGAISIRPTGQNQETLAPGNPVAPPAPQPAAQGPGYAPIRIEPVDHQPEFHHELHPVDYTPEFVDDDAFSRAAAITRRGVGPRPPSNLAPVAKAIGEGVVHDVTRLATAIPQTLSILQRQYNPQVGDVATTEDPLAENVTAATLALAGINMLGPAPKGYNVGVFGGRGARTANLSKLTAAEEFERAGQNPERIRQATGWFRGADGEWRFEIPDTNATFTGYREGGLRQDRVPDVLDHPALMEAYPHLKDVRVAVEDMGPGIMGEHRSAAGKPAEIALNPETGTNRSVLLHEVQHDIQNRENFARGGSYSTPEVSAAAEAATNLRRSELLAEMTVLGQRRDAWIAAKAGLQPDEVKLLKVQKDRNYPSTYDQLAEKFWDEHPDEARRLMELQASTHQLNAAHQRELRAAYRRLGGEVESRNVQTRAGMAPRELERRPPHETEDTPRHSQIIIKQEAGASRAIEDEGAAAPRANEGLQEFPEPDRSIGHEQGRESGGGAAPEARTDSGLQQGGPRGAEGLAEALRAAEDAAGSTRPIEGLPREPLIIEGKHYVPGPIEKIHRIAEDYMKSAGLKYRPLESYQPVKVKRAERIAEQYEKMPHAPNDPAVKASYDALIDETVAQLKALQKSGLKIEFIKPGAPNPYEETPRLAAIDVRDNNHLWVYPTDAGFGSGVVPASELANNPLLRSTGISIDGHTLLANDAFRIVHDFFGHLKDGVGFRAGGEENAWRSHSRMYSAKARPAMTSETRGQNSWLNYGPHGEKNRNAKSADTIYADQKTGIMPNWTHLDGAADPFVAPKSETTGKPIVNAGVDSAPNPKVQTVADPHRMMFPGIYEDPRKVAKEAAERVAPEDLDMKRLWGVSRGELDEMAKGRVGGLAQGLQEYVE